MAAARRPAWAAQFATRSAAAHMYISACGLTGAGDPRTPFADTLEGKLPQKKICLTAAGAAIPPMATQIGLAAGKVQEIYHPGYVAKRMELGAVIAATLSAMYAVKSLSPRCVILVGGRTGRDGCGGRDRIVQGAYARIADYLRR